MSPHLGTKIPPVLDPGRSSRFAIGGLVLVGLLLAASPEAAAERPRKGVYLRLSAGVVYGMAAIEGKQQDKEYLDQGLGGALSGQLGFFVTEKLVLAFRGGLAFWGTAGPGGTYFMGPAVNYYFSNGWHLGGFVGYEAFIGFLEKGEDRIFGDMGIGLGLELGKAWRVSPRWDLGVALQASYARGFGAQGNGLLGGLFFTAAFNAG